MVALTGILAKASADLDADTKAQLEPMMAGIARNVDALSLDAKSKAREARELWHKMVGEHSK
jgi:hypothetical protein